MTIERGQDWGIPAPPGSLGEIASSNAELRELVETQHLKGEPHSIIGLTGGDLWKALGAPSGGRERLDSSAARQVSIDLIECRLDERHCLAAAHLLVLHNWWRGPVTAVMNTEWRGTWRVTPRAHPNDGWLDLLEGDLPVRQRLLLRQRLLTGDHLPNSVLTGGRIKEFSRDFTRPMRVIVDGVEEGPCLSLSLTVLPDALTIIY